MHGLLDFGGITGSCGCRGDEVNAELLLFPASLAAALAAGMSTQAWFERRRRRALARWARQQGFHYSEQASERHLERWSCLRRARAEGFESEAVLIGPVGGRAALLCSMLRAGLRGAAYSLLVARPAPPVGVLRVASSALAPWLERTGACSHLRGTPAPADPRLSVLLTASFPMWLDVDGDCAAIGTPGPLTSERAALLAKVLPALDAGDY